MEHVERIRKSYKSLGLLNGWERFRLAKTLGVIARSEVLLSKYWRGDWDFIQADVLYLRWLKQLSQVAAQC